MGLNHTWVRADGLKATLLHRGAKELLVLPRNVSVLGLSRQNAGVQPVHLVIAVTALVALGCMAPLRSTTSAVTAGTSASCYSTKTAASTARAFVANAIWDKRRLLVLALLAGGPSNQIYQAKQTVFSAHTCRSQLQVVLPPLLPHYSSGNNSNHVPYSSYFELRDKDLLLEADMLSMGVAQQPGAVLPTNCLLYYWPGPPRKGLAPAVWHGNKFPVEQEDKAQRCGRLFRQFQARTKGALCRNVTFISHPRDMCRLASELQGRVPYVLACGLELDVHRRAWDRERRQPELEGRLEEWVGTTKAVRSGEEP